MSTRYGRWTQRSDAAREKLAQLFAPPVSVPPASAEQLALLRQMRLWLSRSLSAADAQDVSLLSADRVAVSVRTLTRLAWMATWSFADDEDARVSEADRAVQRAVQKRARDGAEFAQAMLNGLSEDTMRTALALIKTYETEDVPGRIQLIDLACEAKPTAFGVISALGSLLVSLQRAMGLSAQDIAEGVELHMHDSNDTE